MRRFAIAADRIDGDRVVFDRAESRHLARVVRLRPGDIVVGTDGAGRDYTIRLETVGEQATGTVLAVADSGAESPLAITLLQGIPKGDRMEGIIRAATELGVARVLPVVGARTVVRLEPGRWRERARRWQRVAREAAKQCGRAVVPTVEAPRPLAEWLVDIETVPLALCLWEGNAPSLARALERPSPADAHILVGPEGGLARDEVEAARARGFIVVSLGPRILRTETAGAAVVAILQHRFGNLGNREDERKA